MEVKSAWRHGDRNGGVKNPSYRKHLLAAADDITKLDQASGAEADALALLLVSFDHPNDPIPKSDLDKIRARTRDATWAEYSDTWSDAPQRHGRVGGLWAGRRHRKKHRSRRERRACLGEMAQMDGSEHDWFERSRNGRLPGDGRVERCNGTLQDRLVKASGIGDCPRAELRLAGVSDIAAANALLAKTFLPPFNRNFAVAARDPADLHVPLGKALSSAGKGLRLDEVLCREEQRVVPNDWCVCWRNRVFQLFQLDRRHEALGLAGRRVTVWEKLDGSVQLLSNGHKPHWKELPDRPQRAAAARKERKPIRDNTRFVPPPEHPWKRGAAAPREERGMTLLSCGGG